jgi:hypothetical protein
MLRWDGDAKRVIMRVKLRAAGLGTMQGFRPLQGGAWELSGALPARDCLRLFGEG